MAKLNTQWSNQLISDLQRDMGWSKEAATGFVGALAMESKGFTDWQEDKPLVPGSKGGAGMAQWTGIRRTALEKHARKAGYDNPLSYEAQYSYLRAELRGQGGHDRGIAKKLKGITDASQAEKLTTSIYLRPSKAHRNSSARTAWTNQVAANYKPVPPGNIPEVASELDVNAAPRPLNKTGKVAATQLLNSMRGPDDPILTGGQAPPQPMARSAGDTARAKAANQEARKQPGYLDQLLEEIGVLPSLSSGVKPLNPNNPLGAAPAQTKPQTIAEQNGGKPAPGINQIKTPTTRAQQNLAATAAAVEAAQSVSPVPPAKKGKLTESMGTAIGQYRRPSLSDIKGAPVNVDQLGEEINRSRMNGYREIQEMGPSSKGAKSTAAAVDSNVAPAKPKSGAIRTTAPEQQPIPKGVRPQIVVGGELTPKQTKAPVQGLIELRVPELAASRTAQATAAALKKGTGATSENMKGKFSHYESESKKLMAATARAAAPTPLTKTDTIIAKQQDYSFIGSGIAPGPVNIQVGTPSKKTGKTSSKVTSTNSGGGSNSSSGGGSSYSGLTYVGGDTYVDQSGGAYYGRNLR